MTAARRALRARRLVPLALLGALGVTAAACGVGAGASSVGSTSTSEPPTGVATPADVVAADRRLAAALYQELLRDGQNLFFSPHSIAVALSMLEAGAAGATAEQLQDLLGRSGGTEWHDARRQLAEQLERTDAVPAGYEPLRLHVANGTFGQEGFPFRADYLELLAEAYRSALEQVDFAGDPGAARQQVNDWVAERTEGHITDLLPEGSVDGLTRLVLANAVFFSGNWLHPFDEARTAAGPFHLLDGTEAEADLMRGSVRTSYGAGDGWAAVRLPYAGGSSMLVVVPDEGRLADVEARLGAVLDEVSGLRSDHQVELTLPRFEFATEADLVPVLQRLGVVDVFDPGRADLTGVAEGPPGEDLFVSGAFHEATVAVDEQGTTATAATGVVAGVTSMPAPASLSADRPFLVAIEHDATGQLLFLGRVLDPTA